MIKHKEPNPLNIFGLRQLDHCPPHFTVIEFELHCSAKDISDWIYENLEGRFWYGDVQFNSQYSKAVGFERASEASYFALILSSINKTPAWVL